MSQPNSAEEHKLVSSFEAVRKTLMQQTYSDRWDKPLAYWALPNDRRLPLAFLGKSVGELLRTPYNELSATRGIGQKKISSLVKLLHRATHHDPPAVPYGIKELAEEMEQRRSGSGSTDSASQFDPSLVSEVLWVQWCGTVRRFHLEEEPLGRLAPSLQALPTVIWNARLGEYVDHTLTQIRELRTHGEKRVRVILEVFSCVHELLAGASPNQHLSVRLAPKFVLPIERWLKQWGQLPRLPGTASKAQVSTLPSSNFPTTAARTPVAAFDAEEVLTRTEVLEQFVVPILNQIRIDSGSTVYALARDRLGVDVEPKSVRTQAVELQVTRARIYQLLEDCEKVMHVRWPEGRHLFHGVVTSLRQRLGKTEATDLLVAAGQLFFPMKRLDVELDGFA